MAQQAAQAAARALDEQEAYERGVDLQALLVAVEAEGSEAEAAAAQLRASLFDGEEDEEGVGGQEPQGGLDSTTLSESPTFEAGEGGRGGMLSEDSKDERVRTPAAGVGEEYGYLSSSSSSTSSSGGEGIDDDDAAFRTPWTSVKGGGGMTGARATADGGEALFATARRSPPPSAAAVEGGAGAASSSSSSGGGGSVKKRLFVPGGPGATPAPPRMRAVLEDEEDDEEDEAGDGQQQPQAQPNPPPPPPASSSLGSPFASAFPSSPVQDSGSGYNYAPPQHLPADPEALNVVAAQLSAAYQASEAERRHLRLQLQALRGEEARLLGQVQRLAARERELEEHVLLQGQRMMGQQEGGDVGLGLLRGQMLEAARAQQEKLAAQVGQLEARCRAAAGEREEARREAEAVVAGLREQLTRLASRVASTAVLASAQKREGAAAEARGLRLRARAEEAEEECERLRGEVEAGRRAVEEERAARRAAEAAAEAERAAGQRVGERLQAAQAELLEARNCLRSVTTELDVVRRTASDRGAASAEVDRMARLFDAERRAMLEEAEALREEVGRLQEAVDLQVEEERAQRGAVVGVATQTPGYDAMEKGLGGRGGDGGGGQDLGEAMAGEEGEEQQQQQQQGEQPEGDAEAAAAEAEYWRQRADEAEAEATELRAALNRAMLEQQEEQQDATAAENGADADVEERVAVLEEEVRRAEAARVAWGRRARALAARLAAGEPDPGDGEGWMLGLLDEDDEAARGGGGSPLLGSEDGEGDDEGFYPPGLLEVLDGVRRWGLLVQARAWQEAKAEVRELEEGRARAAARKGTRDAGVQTAMTTVATSSPAWGEDEDDEEEDGYASAAGAVRVQLQVEVERCRVLEGRVAEEKRKAARAEAAACEAREEMAAAAARWEAEKAGVLAELVKEREARLGLMASRGREQEEAAVAAAQAQARALQLIGGDGGGRKRGGGGGRDGDGDDDDRLTTDEAARLVARAVEEAREEWGAGEGKRLKGLQRQFEREKARAAEAAEEAWAARLGEIGRKVKQLQGALTKLSAKAREKEEAAAAAAAEAEALRSAVRTAEEAAAEQRRRCKELERACRATKKEARQAVLSAAAEGSRSAAAAATGEVEALRVRLKKEHEEEMKFLLEGVRGRYRKRMAHQERKWQKEREQLLIASAAARKAPAVTGHKAVGVPPASPLRPAGAVGAALGPVLAAAAAAVGSPMAK